MTNSKNNKRIAKNTLILYFRMFITMIVSLYTVRIVLKTIGVEDFGIYNVVGGIVSMFGFLSGTLSSASQRFLAFEIGKNDNVKLKQTFSLLLSFYIIVALIITFLAETVGVWFLNTQMNIPCERMNAANWVYQFSIFSFIMTILTIPYNASIIAHERMNIYAYVSIIDVILKLIIVYLLAFYSFDKLKLYAVLIFFTASIVTLIYRIYCLMQFQECKYTFFWDKNMAKNILGYSGWNLFGSIAGVLNDQGINILLNIFFGATVNASRAVAYQINTAINNFVTNFYTAVRPQIVKYYAKNEIEKMHLMVFQSSKLSYYLILILSMPFLIESPYILKLWLGGIPQYLVIFTRLVIINTLIESISYPLMTSAQATGRIKKYQIVVGGMWLLNLPISFVLIKLGYEAQITMYVAIFLSIVCLYLRIILLRKLINFPVNKFITDVIQTITLVTIVSYILPLIIYTYTNDGLIRFTIVIIFGLLSSTISIFKLGLNNDERKFIINIIKTKLKQ